MHDRAVRVSARRLAAITTTKGTMKRSGLRIAFLAALAFATCATPGPQPPPQPPAPATFVCNGADSVPNFDAIANDVTLAGQVADDEESFTALDRVAAADGGSAVIRCVIDLIPPDLWFAPVSGVHLLAWEARSLTPPGAMGCVIGAEIVPDSGVQDDAGTWHYQAKPIASCGGAR